MQLQQQYVQAMLVAQDVSLVQQSVLQRTQLDEAFQLTQLDETFCNARTADCAWRSAHAW